MSQMFTISPCRKDIYPFISPQHALKDAARGRVVLITGAGSGIGRTTAEIFGQASAAIVILVGRNGSKLETVLGGLAEKYSNCKFLAQSCDVSSEKSVDDLFARLKQQGIEVDCLINNAGVAAEYATIKDSDPGAWWQSHEIMLKGPYLMSQAFLRQRTKTATPGTILMTSTIGSYRLEPQMSSYCIPKTALNRLAEYVAAEGKEVDVSCIAFHPGGVAETELTAGAPDWLVPLLSETAELAAGTALWLCTEQAAWLSGRYVDARWDMEALQGIRTKVESEDGLKIWLGGHDSYGA